MNPNFKNDRQKLEKETCLVIKHDPFFDQWGFSQRTALEIHPQFSSLPSEEKKRLAYGYHRAMTERFHLLAKVFSCLNKLSQLKLDSAL